MSSEFVGSKSLELDIYGLTVFRCKEISHPFMNLVNTSNPLYEKTIHSGSMGISLCLIREEEFEWLSKDEYELAKQ